MKSSVITIYLRFYILGSDLLTACWMVENTKYRGLGCTTHPVLLSRLFLVSLENPGRGRVWKKSSQGWRRDQCLPTRLLIYFLGKYFYFCIGFWLNYYNCQLYINFQPFLIFWWNWNWFCRWVLCLKNNNIHNRKYRVTRINKYYYYNNHNLLKLVFPNFHCRLATCT